MRPTIPTQLDFSGPGSSAAKRILGIRVLGFRVLGIIFQGQEAKQLGGFWGLALRVLGIRVRGFGLRRLESTQTSKVPEIRGNVVPFWGLECFGQRPPQDPPNTGFRAVGC